MPQDTEPSVGQRYTSRKFWTMIGCIVLFTFLVVLDKIEGSIYEGLMFITIGGYFLANGLEKFSRRT